MGFLDWEGLQKLWTKIKTHVQTSLEGYAKTSDIPSLEGYAKTSDIPDTSNFVTKDANGAVRVESLVLTSKDTDANAGMSIDYQSDRLDIGASNSVYIWGGHGGQILLNHEDNTAYVTGDNRTVINTSRMGEDTSISVNDNGDSGNVRINASRGDVVVSSRDSIELASGENDESSMYIGGEYAYIKSPRTILEGVASISTQDGNYGSAGQVLTTNGETVYWGNASGGDSSIYDLGVQENHKEAQQAMIDHLTDAETGCYLFKYWCSCSGNACLAVVYKGEGYIEGTVYSSDRKFRQFRYDTTNGFVLDGCWLNIACFDEEQAPLETENKTVINAINELNSKIGSGGGGSSTPMIDVTYDELKALRHNGGYIPGMFYRITDYVCTTSQADTRATDHRFDIIVQAISGWELSENAKASHSIEDDYFDSNYANLSAWEIKYCFDNDTTRFAWAVDGQAIINLNSAYSNGEPLKRQPTLDGQGRGEYQYAWGTQADVDDGDQTCFWYSKNEVIAYGETVWSDNGEATAEVVEGKGVIYYMKDEHGNECPYDFKNIQFKRMISLENGYPELDEENGEETWVYTFCGNSYHIDNDEWSELKDGSLEGPYSHQNDERNSTFHHNIVKPYMKFYDEDNEDYTKCGVLRLNDNVFLGYWWEIGSCADDPAWDYAYCCSYVEIGYNCYSNTFNNSLYIKMHDGCGRNVINWCKCTDILSEQWDLNIEGKYQFTIKIGWTDITSTDDL